MLNLSFRDQCNAAYGFLLPLLLVVVTSGSAFAEPWPIKEFEVIGVVGKDDSRELSMKAIANDLNRLIEENGGIAPYFPTLFRTMPVEPEIRAAIEGFLHDSATQMEDWGFLPPALLPIVENSAGRRAFRVYLISNLADNSGEYHPDCHGFSDRILLLSRREIVGGNAIKARGYQTIAHELFHAVQGAHPFFQCTPDRQWVGDWITEGQARAVGWDIAQMYRPLDASSNANGRWGVRDYNQRLPIPLTITKGSQRDPYGTSSFWRYLAERQAGKSLGKKPGPEESPVDYSYLPPMINRGPVGRDCDSRGAPCHAELDWLNASVLTAFGADLRTIYSNFAEALAFYGAYRRGIGDGVKTDMSAGFNWREAVFGRDGCEGAPFGGSHSRRIYHDVFDQVDENSVQCLAVSFKEFDNDVLVELKVTAPPGGTDIVNLNFAIADRPIQTQRAKVKVNNDTRELTAAWVARLPPDKLSYLLVSNVADIPSRTGSMRNLPYTVTVLKEFASMGTGGGGPSASDIDSPLPFELDTIKQAYLYPDPAQQQRENDAGEVCILQFIFQDSRTGDSLGLKADIEGALRPGAYPIYEGRAVDTDENPGQFWSGFAFGHDNPIGKGFKMGYRAVGGTVTIDSVSENYISGSANIVGHNGKPTACENRSGRDAYFKPRGNQLPCPGPQDVVVQAKFGVIPKMSAGLERLGKSMDQCVNQTPLPPSRTSGSGRDPSGDTPGDSAPTDSPTPPNGGKGPESGHSGIPTEPPSAATPGADTAAASGTGEGSTRTAETDAIKRGPRWAIIRATGDVNDTVILATPKFTGGCSNTAPVSIGLRRGQPPAQDYAYLAINTREIIATGQTGTFEVSELNWDYGTVPIPKTSFRAPNRFTGTGTLELRTHDSSQQNRRMEGVIRARKMANHEGQTVDLDAEFRVDWSCGVN